MDTALQSVILKQQNTLCLFSLLWASGKTVDLHFTSINHPHILSSSREAL